MEQTSFLQEVFHTCEGYFEHYYVGAGCITQSVWNVLCGYELGYGIGDIDIVYFDDRDHHGSEESLIEKNLEKELKHLNFSIDVTNEARVHQWYKGKFGKEISPYRSAEEAIDTWPTTASAVGVKKKNGVYEVYAPYGLDDLFKMIVRPNKKLIPKEVYDQKSLKWKRRWPKLSIEPW
ncbi:nucleotidyltransferase family protein [Halobacillus seohaensis]